MPLKNFIIVFFCLTVLTVLLIVTFGFKLEDINQVIEILTPIILLSWFFYYRTDTLVKQYFLELPGTYADFINDNSNENLQDGNAGIIFKISKVYDNGYFLGELLFGQNKTILAENYMSFNQVREGQYIFLGQLKFSWQWKLISVHPFKVKHNRTYNGKLYIVQRLDFDLSKQTIDDFVVHGTYGITFEPTNLVKEVAFRGNKTFRRKE